MRRIAALFAIATVAVIVATWSFIRADVRTVRAAVQSSAVDDVPLDVLNVFVAAEDPCHWKHSRTYTLTSLTAMCFANDDRPRRLVPCHASLVNQLVRYHVTGRGLSRQAREILVTATVEATENPMTVARAYANSVYLGAIGGKHVCGVRDAARMYYGKRVSELDLAECVTLAASIRSPRVYAPDVESERAVVRRLSVLGRLRQLGLVSADDFARTERKLRGVAG